MARKHWISIAVSGIGPILLFGSIATAQAIPPFFGGPVTAFDVEIGVIDSGALLDAQAVVSNDRRYVTINARADNSSLLALQEVRTQAIVAGGSGAPLGFVGGIDPTGKTPRLAVGGPAVGPLPSDIDRADRNAVSILNHRGVALLKPLK